MKSLRYFLALLTLFSCSGKEKATQTNATELAKAIPTTEPSPPVAALPEKSAPTTKAEAGIWRYEKTVDKAGRTVYKASTVSPNLLEFSFPYAGGSTATLTIRKRDSSIHVYIQVSKGQFNRSFQGGKARVLFDQNPPIASSFSAAENGSANIIFFDSEQALITKIKAAKKMTVDVDFEGQGKRQIEFQTADLTWNH